MRWQSENSEKRGVDIVTNTKTRELVCTIESATPQELALIVSAPALREFVAQIARFTTYKPGSTDDFQDAMDTCNRLIADARALLGQDESDDDDEEEDDLEPDGQRIFNAQGVTIADYSESAQRCQHRDDGRGCCADCGEFL